MNEHIMETCDLASRSCVPCKGGVPPLQGDDLSRLHAELGNGWQLAENRRLEKVFKFKDFVEALAFTNRIGALAEQQGHHPDIELSWGKVTLRIWTHKIGGLTESDFILAAKSDSLEKA